MNKTIVLIISSISLFFEIFVSKAEAWENELTHPSITQKAAERSVLAGDYLKTQLEFKQ
jgi:hypothetical protein